PPEGSSGSTAGWRTPCTCSSAVPARAVAPRVCRARSAGTSMSRSTRAARGSSSGGCSPRVSILERAGRRQDEPAKGGSMKFIALIYGDETTFETLPAEERSELYERYMTVGNDMREAGVYVDANQLSATRDATSVRVREAETLVVDGPYAEVKEALGGYYLL